MIGATGLVGARCVAHLLEREAYERVTCLVRRPLAEAHPRLEQRVVDFASLGASDVEGYEDLFCAIGTTIKKAGSRAEFRRVDVALPLEVARLAVASGTRRIALVSSVGADARSRVFYLRVKGELEEALAALALEALHVFRPASLLGRRTEPRPGEAAFGALAKATQGLLFGRLRRWRPIEADDVARAMVAAMLGPDPRPFVRTYEHDDIMRLATEG